MEPIPETKAALARLSRYTEQEYTQGFAGAAKLTGRLAPDCVGVTLTYLREGLSFTWVASGVDAAALDAMQYLDGGPCVTAVDQQQVIDDDANPLDEQRWQIFASGENVLGVASTLSLPMMSDGEVYGSINLYGSTAEAFEGRHEVLAAVWGGWPAGAVTNADLALTSMKRSRDAPRVLASQDSIEQAIGMLMVAHEVDAATARQDLRNAAERSGLDETEVATFLVRTQVL